MSNIDVNNYVTGFAVPLIIFMLYDKYNNDIKYIYPLYLIISFLFCCFFCCFYYRETEKIKFGKGLLLGNIIIDLYILEKNKVYTYIICIMIVSIVLDYLKYENKKNLRNELKRQSDLFINSFEIYN